MSGILNGRMPSEFLTHGVRAPRVWRGQIEAPELTIEIVSQRPFFIPEGVLGVSTTTKHFKDKEAALPVLL
jgi:hypothetical protein